MEKYAGPWGLSAMTKRKECPKNCDLYGECNAADKRACTIAFKKWQKEKKGANT
jgi:hypothetical protein